MKETLDAPAQNYSQSIAQERASYDSCLNVHELPEIFHYWSNRYLRPTLLEFGFASPDAMFSVYLDERCRETAGRATRFVSLGSGNCELEIGVARELRARGHERFVIECLDLNPAMLARGRAAAAEAGVKRYLEFTECDLNKGIPAREYDAAIANQSLHHMVELETVFSQVKRSLTRGGIFAISDMIGRNGHQRWPEALAIVHEFWRKLPPSYRFNPRLGRYEELYEDWDCSGVGFEGVRAQDILPLLLREFHFRLFVPFANVVDPFVDRTFGYNFDAAAEWDRNFIDQVHQRDAAEIAAGRLTPTHMLAVAGNDETAARKFPGHLSPEFCVRKPGGSPDKTAAGASGDPYLWGSWPHAAERELKLACKRLGEVSRQLRERESQVAELEKEIEKRTAWALGLDKELNERTAWALSMQAELKERKARTEKLERKLQAELETKERALEPGQSGPVDAARLVSGAWRRAKGAAGALAVGVETWRSASRAKGRHGRDS